MWVFLRLYIRLYRLFNILLEVHTNFSHSIFSFLSLSLFLFLNSIFTASFILLLYQFETMNITSYYGSWRQKTKKQKRMNINFIPWRHWFSTLKYLIKIALFLFLFQFLLKWISYMDHTHPKGSFTKRKKKSK